MKRRLFSILAILLFVLSGCQKEPTSKYILPIEAQYFLGKESYESVKEHDTESFPKEDSIIEMDDNVIVVRLSEEI